MSVALAVRIKVFFTCKLSTIKPEGSEKKETQKHILTENFSIIADLIMPCTTQNFRGEEGGGDAPWVVLAGWGSRLIPRLGSAHCCF